MTLADEVAKEIFEQREAQRCAPSQGEEWLPMRKWEELDDWLRATITEEARAAISVFAKWLREPEASHIPFEGGVDDFCRALANHIEEQK